MLPVALIVFREVLEAALLIGVLFAATRGVAGRGYWISAGVFFGVCGAFAVALGAERIASMMEGMGQELFNAGVLFVAVLMLSGHTLWMKAHARELVATNRTLSRQIRDGQRPLYALAVIVSLAVLREGSEIVLFLSGMFAAGNASHSGLVAGGAMGLFGGILVGAGIAVGLLKIPTRYLFAVTGWWIALLASGMAAQAVAFLTQAGFISHLTETAWDTSQIVSDRSLSGQALRALIGYVATPMTIQVIVYSVTFAILCYALLRKQPASTAPRQRGASIGGAVGSILAIWVLLNSTNARADFTVYSPYVEYGEWELEFRAARSFDNSKQKDNAQDYVYEFAYSPTQHWHTALFLEAEREPGESLYPTEFAWENLFQLTEPGEYWLDLGAYVEYSKGLKHGVDHALEWKVLAEKTVGQWTFTANPIFVQEFVHGDDPDVQFEYAWGTHYRLQPTFEPGFEAYGQVGEITNVGSLAQQEHFIGPDVRGRFHLGSTGSLVYNVGYLFGVTRATPTGTVKLELEYELRF